MLFHLTVLLFAAVLSAGGTWKVAHDYYALQATKIAAEAQKKVEAADERAAKAASDWEVWAASQKPKIIYRDRRVADAFKSAPEWSATPLPAGVRDELAAPAPGQDPVVAAAAVPAAPAASVADQSGSRPAVPWLAGLRDRMREAARRSGEGREQP